MKQKMISRLVIGALAGVAAAGAFAGQIQASSVSIAREVIIDNAQAITSPSISYRFAGDVDARLQNQTFQVQFKLDKGTWASAGLKQHVVLTDGISGTAVAQGTGPGQYDVVALALDTDKKILFATITVYADAATGLIRQPLVSISGGSVAQNPTISGLYSVVGPVGPCDKDVRNLAVNVKHFVALSDPTALAVEGSPTATPDEHKRAGATNDATLVTFPTNVFVEVTKSTGDAKIDVTAGAKAFAGSVAAGPAFVDASTVNLGKVNLKQQAFGYDANLIDQYLVAGRTLATGVAGVAGNAAAVNGIVEARQLAVKVSATQGFAVGGTISLNTAADCNVATRIAGSAVTITTTNQAGPVTTAVGSGAINAALGASGTNAVHVCYNVPTGASAVVIPGSSFAVDAATLVKAPDGGTFVAEQNNSCNGTLYALSGSIKIDVRNYASAGFTQDWETIIRVINPSEVRKVDVFGQYILPDGTYGRWGKLGTLDPRQSINWSNVDVDKALNQAPAHPTAALNNTGALPTGGSAPRLRITSPNADTLRVQSYLYNKKSNLIVETSGSQGVDWERGSDRAPAGEGQFMDQDAQKGLNGGN